MGGAKTYRLGAAAGSHVSWTHITSGRSFSRRYSNSASLSGCLRSLPSSELAFQVTKLRGSDLLSLSPDPLAVPPNPVGSSPEPLARLLGSGTAGWKNRFMRDAESLEAG